MVKAVPLPQAALLNLYRGDSHTFTDCYAVRLEGKAAFSDFVEVFYTGWIFKLERMLLGVLAAKPSTDEEARKLARGQTDHFAAWQVEARATDELLLCDFRGRTRSWLMIRPTDDGAQTILYFGSAVVASTDSSGASAGIPLGYRLLLGFHRRYSKILLAAAHRKLSH